MDVAGPGPGIEVVPWSASREERGTVVWEELVNHILWDDAHFQRGD